MSTFKTNNHAYVGAWKKTAVTFRALLDESPDCRLYQIMHQYACSQYCKAVERLNASQRAQFAGAHA